MARKLYLIFFLASLKIFSVTGQVVTSDPAIPIANKPLIIFFNAAGTDLAGFTGDVFAHTGVNNWQHVIGTWGNNTNQPRLTRISTDRYQLELNPSIRAFYNVPANVEITQIAVVFRSADGTRQTRPDIFIPVHKEGLNVSIVEPFQKSNIYELGQIINIRAVATQATSIRLFINNIQVASTTTDNFVTYSFNSATYGFGSFWAKARATDGITEVVDSAYIFVRSQPQIIDLPPNVRPGINYINDNTVTLVLHDPPAKKNYAFVIGDFNNWMVTEDAYMNRTPSGKHFWLTITNLQPGREYGFQYLIDGNLRIADPYTEKVLDPWNDGEIINEGRYPGLIPYPHGKTEHPVSVFQTAQQPFVWQTTGFVPPAVEDLVIYELLIRDFLQNNTYRQLRDTLGYLKRLGINAIQLMPVTEFEGNSSWGYNPSFFFAPDKYYGPRNELKRFIDAAHGKGMAVILDIVWNHSFGQAPLLRMYFDSQNNRPSDDNPWYSMPIYHNPAMNFGFKFDHGSPYFIEFMYRANRHWLEEYRMDGFRFDLTKGFTTRFKGPDDFWGSAFDQERVDNLKRLYNHIKSITPHAYVIIEHLADNSEERVLADHGMLLWGNMNYNYNEATMGYHDGGKSNLSWGLHTTRGWRYPHLITYMESHDEERLMFRNINFGNSVPNYNTRQLDIALRRMELAATFFFTLPGPKMIWQFGELGYDMSINRCPDGTISGACRLDPKPVLWNYYNDWRRNRLYDIYAALIKLKTEHPVFRTTDFATLLADPVKRIQLNHATNRVNILGNFDVRANQVIPGFQQTGTWHEFFTRQTLIVTDVNAPITLQAGEYRLYSTVPFPDHGVSTPIIETERDNRFLVYPNPAATGFNVGFEVQELENVTINIYNLNGQKIATIFNQIMHPGSHVIPWNRTTSGGYKIPAGIYIVTKTSGKVKSSQPVVLF